MRLKRRENLLKKWIINLLVIFINVLVIFKNVKNRLVLDGLKYLCTMFFNSVDFFFLIHLFIGFTCVLVSIILFFQKIKSYYLNHYCPIKTEINPLASLKHWFYWCWFLKTKSKPPILCGIKIQLKLRVIFFDPIFLWIFQKLHQMDIIKEMQSTEAC